MNNELFVSENYENFNDTRIITPAQKVAGIVKLKINAGDLKIFNNSRQRLKKNKINNICHTFISENFLVYYKRNLLDLFIYCDKV